jgi:hypothetical protein
MKHNCLFILFSYEEQMSSNYFKHVLGCNRLFDVFSIWNYSFLHSGPEQRWTRHEK